ncbi:MAG TPA: dynamin family protein [Mycobacteriales bacterium]|nr:dynamin family protein [Mycobacteriales bacterium]
MSEHYPAAAGGQPAAGVLCRVVADTCAALRPRLSQPTGAGVEQISRRLSGPLQLAIAGRIKSGKSTVVNALIGRRVAPTDIRECTRIVTRFSYGTVDRVEVVRTNGNRVTLPYDADGLVPSDIGVDPADVALIDAYLTSATLRDVTVIDTPGLGSLDAASAARTRHLLGETPANVTANATANATANGTAEPADGGLDAGSHSAIAQAEAVLFVLTQAARADDVDTLSIFRAYTTPKASSPVNAIAVLNKADQIVADDPLAAAAELAAAQARTLHHRVSDVLPLVGLVAEATETGLFTEADADTLRRIAALDPGSRTLLFLSTDLFLRPEIPVPVPARARLLERLDLFGITQAIALLDADPGLSAGELRRRLVGSSGFPAVRAVVDTAFRRRADGIKANVAIAALESLAAAAPYADRMHISDALEELMQRPEAHQLRLLEVASLVTSGTVAMPAELGTELARLVVAADPAEQLGLPGQPPEALAHAALDAAARWRSFATFGSTPAQSRVAHVVHRGYFLLWQQLQTGLNGGGR